MDFNQLIEFNRKIESLTKPYAEMTAAMEKIKVNLPINSMLAEKSRFLEVLQPSAGMMAIVENSRKWESFKNHSAELMAFRNRIVPDLQPEILKAIDLYKSPAFTIPPEVLAQRDFIQKYTETLRPSNFSVEYYKQYSVLRQFDQILRFDYDLDSLTIDEEEGVEEKAKVKKAKTIRDTIHQIYQDNSKLITVHPREFEKMIAELMAERGYDVELTKQTRDGGKDIIAMKIIDGFPLRFLVECKRLTKDKVDVDIVRSFSDVILNTEKVNKGIIFTTSYFTKDAEDRRLINPWLMDFRDKDDILRWVSEYTQGRI